MLRALTCLGKLDSLKLAAAAFHWNGANGLLSQLARELDVSGLETTDLTAYLDSVYSDPWYGEFDVAMAIELAAMRGTGLKPPSGALRQPLCSGRKTIKRHWTTEAGATQLPA